MRKNVGCGPPCSTNSISITLSARCAIARRCFRANSAIPPSISPLAISIGSMNSWYAVGETWHGDAQLSRHGFLFPSLRRRIGTGVPFLLTLTISGAMICVWQTGMSGGYTFFHFFNTNAKGSATRNEQSCVHRIVFFLPQ